MDETKIAALEEHLLLASLRGGPMGLEEHKANTRELCYEKNLEIFNV